MTADRRGPHSRGAQEAHLKRRMKTFDAALLDMAGIAAKSISEGLKVGGQGMKNVSPQGTDGFGAKGGKVTHVRAQNYNAGSRCGAKASAKDG